MGRVLAVSLGEGTEKIVSNQISEWPSISTKNFYFTARRSFWKPYFSQFLLCLTSNNSSSRNIGGTDAWAVPPPQILL